MSHLSEYPHFAWMRYPTGEVEVRAAAYIVSSIRVCSIEWPVIEERVEIAEVICKALTEWIKQRKEGVE